ncbi:hypothetical protein HMEPL2_37770 [Vreelandella aquamarina]|uniref:Uncharacterized protein n=1 Tax=Vreelandella aquamarina TaxID=77097 RepID=A0A6F8XHY6_9GAMM|nr:hypothetical protein HMEPL2_37770 [Halomonas meridiana]|tara:strand:- start:516 stop:689 length:174 start_codon:yes stop_codon:yes gene_type:complete
MHVSISLRERYITDSSAADRRMVTAFVVWLLGRTLAGYAEACWVHMLKASGHCPLDM